MFSLITIKIKSTNILYKSKYIQLPFALPKYLWVYVAFIIQTNLFYRLPNSLLANFNARCNKLCMNE